MNEHNPILNISHYKKPLNHVLLFPWENEKILVMKPNHNCIYSSNCTCTVPTTVTTADEYKFLQQKYLN